MSLLVDHSTDLSGTGFPSVKWDGTQDAESLGVLRGFIVHQAEQASTWYFSHRKTKRFFGRALRLLTLTATSFAGIIPMLSQIYTRDGKSSVPPAWASVALAVSAASVAIDYFFGFSTGWIRFMAAQQKIARFLREFEFDWETLRATWNAEKLSLPQVVAALTRLKQAALQIQLAVEDETNLWIAEFSSSLRLLDEAAKAKLETPMRSAINVNVTNGGEASEWTLAVDESTPIRHQGGRAAILGLTPGSHKLRIEGKIDDRLKSDEAAVTVPATGVTEITLTLR